MSEPLIQVRDLHRVYRRPRTSLLKPPPTVHARQGVSFDVTAGQRFGIVGENQTIRFRVLDDGVEETGDRVRVNLTNKLDESTVIHFHGLELPISQDGVPFITQPPVKPGETYTYGRPHGSSGTGLRRYGPRQRGGRSPAVGSVRSAAIRSTTWAAW